MLSHSHPSTILYYGTGASIQRGSGQFEIGREVGGEGAGGE